MNEKLLMDVVRMFREREEHYDKVRDEAFTRGDYRTAAIALGKSLAYDSAREMLMAALTNNVEILSEYDYFTEEE